MIGQGGRGAWITKLFAEHGGYQVAAVADYFPEVVQSSGSAVGVAEKRRFSGLDGYKRLLESQVDAVALETPPYFFPEHAAAAVAAGCHVYMAKPVAIDVPGCLTIAELGKKASAGKKAFLVDFQIRTNPEWAECIRRIRRGDLGKLAMICSYYHSEGFPDPPKTDSVESRLRHLIWCNDVDLGGTHLVNASIHAIDGALWVAGDTQPVTRNGTQPYVSQGSARRQRGHQLGYDGVGRRPDPEPSLQAPRDLEGQQRLLRLRGLWARRVHGGTLRRKDVAARVENRLQGRRDHEPLPRRSREQHRRLPQGDFPGSL